jgi:choline dehydrogenase-like flavoprotein
MITDLQALPTGLDLAADICIVGSGFAGLTLASEFAHTKHTVIVLEAGGFDYERATQELYAGQVVGRDYPIKSSRSRMFGGTSSIWGGQCGILPIRHMRERPWVADSSWPISPDELLPYYRKASRMLELGNIDHDEANAAGLVRNAVLSAEGPLVPYVWRFRLDGALRLGEQMKRPMEKVANIHVVLHANVTHLKTNERANQLKEIQFTTLDGNTGVARARYFVLACGGLEIPRLLLNTDDVQPTGLGNSRGLVGRYFMENPNGIIGTLFLANAEMAEKVGVFTEYVRDATPPVGFWKPAICLGETFEREQKINAGYYRFHGRKTTWSREWSRWREGSSFLHRIHTVARLFDERMYGAYREAYGYTRSATEFAHNEAPVYVEFEQMPNQDSRVSLTRNRDRLGLRRLALDWRLSEQDIRTARALGEAIGREAYLSGLGRFQFAEWLLEEGIERSSEFGISFHHTGTTRMASDPQFGVVDSECRVFGCDNLYIASSAVFPTAS